MKNIISNKIKEKFNKIKLNELELFLNEYRKRHFNSIETKMNGKDSSYYFVLFILLGLERSKKLYKGAINCLNNADLISAFLSVRAHMESTGAIAYFLNKLCQYYKREISFEEIHSYLEKLCFGRKDYSNEIKYPEKIYPINVCSMIDSVDNNFLTFTDEKIFRYMYDCLSEFCHPNFFGQMIGIKISVKKTIFPDFSEKHELEESEINHFYCTFHLSCTLFFKFYDECFSLIEKNEKMPNLV